MIFDGPLTAPAQVAELMADKLPLRRAAKRPPPPPPIEPPAPRSRQRGSSGHSASPRANSSQSPPRTTWRLSRADRPAVRRGFNQELALAVANSLDPKQGAVSFWFRPEWQFALEDKTVFW